MDIFDVRYYRINKRLLKMIGQWPYQSQKQRRILWIIMYISIGTVLLVQALKLVQLRGKIDMMVECMVPMAVQIVACLKSSNCIVNSVKMKTLLDLMKKNWTYTTDEKEMRILTNYAKKGFMLGLFYVVSVFGSMVIYLAIPLGPQILDALSPLNKSRPRQFLYQTEYYIDEDDYYTIIMVHNYCGTILTILVVVSVDAMLLAYVHHICAIFTIIGLRMQNLVKYDKDSSMNHNWNVNSEHFCTQISKCIKDHEHTLEFVRLIEAAYSMSFLFQIGISMLMISATGLQVVANLGNYEEIFRHAQFILGQLFHLFVNSWPGQMLADHTYRFRECVYFAEWYKFPLRERQFLRLVMLRSLKPCKMTAGKLYDMSMENFGKVIQTSMSYFTVLLSMRQTTE